MNNSLFVIERARAEDAAALLDYLKIVGGETENLSFGAEGVPLSLEAEQDYLRSQCESADNVQYLANPKLAKLAEEIRFADPTPTNMDEEIVQMLEALSNDADTEKIKKAEKMLMQRKVIAKESKG